MQIMLGKNSISHSPQLIRLQLEPVICGYQELTLHRGSRVSGWQAEGNKVEGESTLLMGKKGGRIISFIALPRAGPEGKGLAACCISLAYHL